MTTLKSGHQVWNSFTHWCITVAGHTITTGPRPTYLKSHAPQSTDNHHWSQAHIPKTTCITVNTQSPMDLCPHLWNYTHHRKHTITPGPMSMYHMHHRKHNQHHIMCITQNTITTRTMSTYHMHRRKHNHHSNHVNMSEIICITENIRSPPDLGPRT